MVRHRLPRTVWRPTYSRPSGWRLRRLIRLTFVVVALSSLVAFLPDVSAFAACASNPIVCENALTGNPATEWDISGAGDPNIQGFATDISVNVGQTVRFKINTVSSHYRLDIYRMGYYQGNGARKITSIDVSLPKAQVQP